MGKAPIRGQQQSNDDNGNWQIANQDVRVDLRIPGCGGTGRTNCGFSVV